MTSDGSIRNLMPQEDFPEAGLFRLISLSHKQQTADSDQPNKGTKHFSSPNAAQQLAVDWIGNLRRYVNQRFLD